MKREVQRLVMVALGLTSMGLEAQVQKETGLEAALAKIRVIGGNDRSPERTPDRGRDRRDDRAPDRREERVPNSREIDEMQRVLQEVDGSVQDWRFYSAAYKLRVLKLKLKDFDCFKEGKEALEHIEIALEALDDSKLRSREKEQIAQEELRSVAVSIECLSRVGDRHDDRRDDRRNDDRALRLRDLDDSLQALDTLLELVRRENYPDAQRLTEVLRSFIDHYGYDRSLQTVVGQLQRVEDDLSSSYSSDYSKLSNTETAVRSMKSSIKRSDTYRREHGIDYRNAETKLIGKTDLFSKSKFETRTLNVELGLFPVRALKVFARDDSVQIQEVTIELEGGSRICLEGGVVISENDSTFFDIPAPARKIKSISVTANSAALFGTKARVEIQGVR